MCVLSQTPACSPNVSDGYSIGASLVISPGASSRSVEMLYLENLVLPFIPVTLFFPATSFEFNPVNTT